jgi:hypothetical protein
MQRVCSDVLVVGYGRRIGELVEGRGPGVFSHNPLTKVKVNLDLEHAMKTQRRRCIALLFLTFICLRRSYIPYGLVHRTSK